MNIITIIECAYGMPGPDRYIKQICEILGVSTENINSGIHYEGMHYFLIDDVDEVAYYSSTENISQIFLKLYNSRLIQYFYIGEYSGNKKSIGKLNTVTEMYY